MTTGFGGKRMKTCKSGFGSLIGTAILSVVVLGAQAQTIYRIVGADGKLTFSDKPPASAEQGKVMGTGVGAAGAAASNALPFELRQLNAKYPVTLYTAPKCAPCDSGRSLLSGRGIPFSERTVTSPEDSEYFQRLTGESSLPFISIGGQRLKGYSESEWTGYLDAAGYPKSSTLPSGYRNAPPSPLVSVQKTKVEDKLATEPVAPPVTPAGPTPSNPAGIAF
jgi:glutaredoxin